MSDSLQSKDRARAFLILFGIAFLFFCLNFGLAMEFGVSPPSLDFEMLKGDMSCKEARVVSSLNNLPIRVDDKWIKDAESSEIGDFVYNAKELNIEIRYEKSFLVESEKVIEICLIGNEAGKYKGVLLFEALNGSLSIGSWLNVNINGENDNLAGKGITGLFAKDFENISSEIKGLIPVISFNIFLFVVLIVLLVELGKKRKRNLARRSKKNRKSRIILVS